VVGDIEFRSDRTCCVCREPRQAFQIHHLDGDHSNNDPDNLAWLCVECHHEAEAKSTIGRKLSPEAIRRYRDDWYATVAARRERARVGAEADPEADHATRVRRLIREGKELETEVLYAGHAAESSLDRRSVEEREAEHARFRDREEVWTTACEMALAATQDAAEFSQVFGTPATGLYAIHNRVKARAEFLEGLPGKAEARRPGNPRDQLAEMVDAGMKLRTAEVLRPDAVLPFSHDPLYQWARRAFDLLRAHFVLFADEFYGEDPELGSGYFGLAYACATTDMDRSEYLESRIEILKSALRAAG
jgi:hypothetical protein